MAWIDLHMHSCYSVDGEYTPEELMARCRRAGVRCAALADHNTVRGVKEALAAAGHEGVELIPAVELDCTHREVDLHVLGYGINPDCAGFAAVEEDIRQQEPGASQIRLARVRDLGLAVDDAEIRRLAPDGVITGEVIAEVALAQKENESHPLLAPYRPGGGRDDNPCVNFYWDFCARGKAAYAPVRYLDLPSAICLIRDTGGIPVLAHPGNNVREDGRLLHDIVRHGICGLEVYSSYHSAAQTVFYRDFAEELSLIVTCGSDFHGRTKPSISVGSVDCEGREAEIRRLRIT